MLVRTLLAVSAAAPLAHGSLVEWPLASGGNGHSYEAVLNPGVTWGQGRDDAAARGGYLATITSADENQFVFGLIATEPFWEPFVDANGRHVAAGPWLGAWREANSAVWHWVTNEPFAYSAWADGEPNNITSDEFALQFMGKSPQALISPTWNDAPWTGTFGMRGYVIEYAPAPGVLPLGALLLAMPRRRAARR